MWVLQIVACPVGKEIIVLHALCVAPTGHDFPTGREKGKGKDDEREGGNDLTRGGIKKYCLNESGETQGENTGRVPNEIGFRGRGGLKKRKG